MQILLQMEEEAPDHRVVLDEGGLAFFVMFVQKPQIAHLGYRTGESVELRIFKKIPSKIGILVFWGF